MTGLAAEGERIPAVLCIDVEPDARCMPVPAPGGWPGFARTLDRIKELRSVLERGSDQAARFGWFLRMDPQVEVAYGHRAWVVDEHGDDLARLTDAGDELGLHPHSWRWTGEEWVSDQADADWVLHCADEALAAYREAFGVPCVAYRHGDRFTSAALQTHIAGQGVRVDLSLEPGLPSTPGLALGERTTGTIPAVPLNRSGVHPSEAPAAESLLMVPLTTAPTLGAQDGGAPFASETLTLWTPPRVFAARLAARLSDPALGHLAFAVRTDAGLDDVAWSAFVANLGHLADVLGSRLAWITPSEVLRWEGGFWADDRPGSAWPASIDGDRVLADYARAAERAALESDLERLVMAVSHDTQRAHAQRVITATEDRLRESAAAADSMRHTVDRLQAELAEMRATTTWRWHDRLLPILRLVRRLASRRPR